MPATDALLALESSRSGLSAAEAARRLHERGANELEQKPPRTPLAIFAAQFKSSMAALLVVAAVLAAALGDIGDMIAILAILLLNGILGYVQEGRAERAIEELKRMASPMARVIRDGAAIDIDSRGVVPGDLLVIEAGQIVPADARLIESASLGVQEAAGRGRDRLARRGMGGFLFGFLGGYDV